MKPNDPTYNIFLKVIQKHKKPNILNSKITGNSLNIGNPGYGKSTSLRRECEIRYNFNHKIFLLYDAGRLDSLYMKFPSTHPFWKVPKLEYGKVIGPKSYPVEGLTPVTKGLPDRLPNNFRLFTIPVNSLDENDLIALLGQSSADTIRAAYNYMSEKVDENTTAIDYIKILQEATGKVDKKGDTKDLSPWGPKKLIETVFRPLLQQGLLSSANVSTAINIENIIKDKKIISALVLRHCPRQYWGFLVYYFMNHINKLLSGFGTTKPIKQKTTIMMNEVSDLLSEDSEKGSSAYSLAREIEKIAKQYRTASLYLIMDTQLPGDLPEIKETLQRCYVFNSSLPSIRKAMEMIGISESAGDINADDYIVIPRLSKGWYYLFDRDNGTSIHKLMYTRSRNYEDGENFYDIYDKVIGKSAYFNTKPILTQLKDENELSEKAWELKLTKKIELKKNKEKTVEIKNKVEEVSDKVEEVADKIEEVKVKPTEIPENKTVPKKITKNNIKKQKPVKNDNLPKINGSKVIEEIEYTEDDLLKDINIVSADDNEEKSDDNEEKSDDNEEKSDDNEEEQDDDIYKIIGKRYSIPN